MKKYCIDLNLPLTLFNTSLNTIDFLKQDDQHLARHYMINKDLLSNEVIEFLKDHGLMVRLVEIFYRPASTKSRIHIDTENPGDFAKLNWAYGGKDSVMNWYDTKETYVGITNSTASSSYAIFYNECDVNLIHSQKVGVPSLVQVGIPHSVNNILTDRFCVSIVFEYIDTHERPTFEQAYEIFKHYVK